MTETENKILHVCNDILGLIGISKADKYDRIADRLTNSLLHKWDAETKAAIGDMVTRLRKLTGKPKPKQIDDEIGTLAMRLGPKFANEVNAVLYEAHVESFTKAQKEIKPSFAASFTMTDEKAIQALHDHNVYWVRNNYDNNLRAKTEELGKRIISEGLDFRQAGQIFEDELGDQYQAHGTNYWRGYATNVVTRSREIGRVNGYEKAGVEYLEIRAVLDHRTTKICREMHGRIIEVKKAIEMRDKLIDAENPEDVTKIAQWQSEDFVRGKKSDALPAGMSLPPYHFRCRTRTVVAGVGDDIVDVEYGDGMSAADKKYWKARTPQELSNLARTAWERQKYQWNPEKLKVASLVSSMQESDIKEWTQSMLDDRNGLYGMVEDGSWGWIFTDSKGHGGVMVGNEMQVVGIVGKEMVGNKKSGFVRFVIGG